MDRTLNATRNSNSFEDGPNQSFPQTAATFVDDDLSRAEESKRTPYGKVSLLKDEDSKDDLERDSQSGALPQISEQESMMNRSILIAQEHEKIAKSEVKQN